MFGAAIGVDDDEWYAADDVTNCAALDDAASECACANSAGESPANTGDDNGGAMPAEDGVNDVMANDDTTLCAEPSAAALLLFALICAALERTIVCD